jgi:hypothetical protein
MQSRTTALERQEHGQRRTYQCGCRCAGCRRAQSDYARTRWAVQSVLRTGSARWKVDSEPVLGHLDVLLASGWTQREIAARAGVPLGTLRSLRGRRRRKPRTWNTVSDAVLALDATLRS